MKGACHCGAVRFEIAAPPAWVLDCNCTLCRRYGALWAYTRSAEPIELLSPPTPGATETNIWNDEELAFHRCAKCGCVMHMEARQDPPWIYGVNMRMLVGLDPATVRLRQVDNGHTGFFWTRSSEPVIASKQPRMPPPGPDDWR